MDDDVDTIPLKVTSAEVLIDLKSVKYVKRELNDELFLKCILDDPNNTTKKKIHLLNQNKEVLKIDVMFVRKSNLEILISNAHNKTMINFARKIPLEELILYKKNEFQQIFKNEKLEVVIEFSVQLIPMIEKEMIVFYDFRGKFFDSIEDYSGRGINAKIKNLQTFNVQKIKGPKSKIPAGRFNGLNFLDLFFNPLEGYSEFSISFWFKNSPEHPQKEFPIISTLEKMRGFVIGNFYSTFTMNDNSKLKFQFEDENEKQFFITEIYKIKDWNHKVVTFNGSVITEYFNGIKTNSKEVGRIYMSSGKKMLIGSEVNDCDFTGYQGDLTEIRMYNYCLQFEEINNLYEL